MYRKLLVLGLLCAVIGLSVAQETLDCTQPLEVWQIQGSGENAQCLNQKIRTENNLVTGVALSGFFIQTPTERSDNDHTTSDGIFVYTNTPAQVWGLQVGDLVSIEGKVNEFYNLTQINVLSKKAVTITASGQSIPEPVDLLSIDYATLEAYEGQRVTVADALIVAPTNQFGEIGISLTGQRAFREAGLEVDNYPQFAAENIPNWDLNREIIEVVMDATNLPVEQVHTGGKLSAVGNLAYAYQDYQLWASELTIEPAEFQPRPVRERTEGEFTIATQNVENLYDLVDEPNIADTSTEDYVPATLEEYQIKLRKLSAQIREVLGAPDIVAIQEIENTRTLTDLIFQIYTDDPTLRYWGCLEQGNDGRGINNAFLVRVDRVSVQACYQMPGSKEEVGVFGGQLHDRPPLVLEASLVLGKNKALPLTLINLHNKSLSGIDQDENQQQRYRQAVSIANYIQNLQTTQPDVHLIVLGDYNAFQFTDGLVDMLNIIQGTAATDNARYAPETDLVEPDLILQEERVPAEDRYSYIFNSNLQVLDHILTTANVDALVTEVQFSRGNADALLEWATLDNGAWHSSDHDGQVLFLRPQ